MNVYDILINNIKDNNKEENINNPNYVKKPEKILRFFKLSGINDSIKNDVVNSLSSLSYRYLNEKYGVENIQFPMTINSDSVSKYTNIYLINGESIENILKSVSIDGEKTYESIDDLQYDTDNIINKINKLINKSYINENELNNPNSELNTKINEYQNSNHIYIVPGDIVEDLENGKDIIDIPKYYYIYSEKDTKNIEDKIKNI